MSLFSGIASKILSVASNPGIAPPKEPIAPGTLERKANQQDMPSQHEAHVYQQEPFRAGLLVTDEYEKAVARCREKVAELAEECSSLNRRFRDIEFDLGKDEDQCLHSLSTPDSEKFKPADVLRVSQIFDNPQFVVDGFQSSDIVQGRLGNCWLLCAVATVSSMPDLIKHICVARNEKVGIYGFIFCRDGEWVDVIIDDQLFVSVPKWETLLPDSQNLYHKDKELYDNVARKGSKTLFFARSSQENETWVPLLEKAFAKLHGDYASLSGGFAFQALEDLTGGVSQIVYANDIYDKDEFWNGELMRATKDRLFGCYLDSLAGKGIANDTTTTNGLITSHAYSILRALEYNGKRFLKIRNPWGRGEWNGKWSDGSKEWTKEWLPALDLLEHQFGDDGSFIMEYEDFLKTWYAIERTQLFDETWIQSSHWLNVTSRTFPCPWQYGDVSFSFTITEESPSVLVLSQADSRYWNELSGYSLWTFDFVLYKKGGTKIIGRSEYSIQWPRSVTLTKRLEAGDYVLHVRLDRNYHRQKNYIQTSISDWDNRKMARVWSEAARSMSMAANYEHKAWRNQRVVEPEFFAGKDLLQLEVESFEASKATRKSLKASFFPSASKVTVSTEAAKAVEPTGSASTSERGASETTESSGVVVLAESGMHEGTSVSVVVKSHENEMDARVTPPMAALAENENSETSKPEERKEGASKDPLAKEDENPVSPTSPSEGAISPETIQTLLGGGLQLPSSGPQGIESAPPPPPPNIDPSRRDVHTGIGCDVCGKAPVVGTRWKCLVCENYDLCDECYSSGKASNNHSVDHRVLRMETREILPVHEGIICDGCKANPVIGTRWKCLICNDFDLCDACHYSGSHSQHQMLQIETPADADDLREEIFPNDDDTLLMGLRVYTKRGAKVAISGQLRHGKLISWRKPK